MAHDPGALSFPAGFFARNTVAVARDLIGCWLWHGELGGVIVESEAYTGLDDPASHAYRGPTPRARIMFEEPGRAYVYLSYGVHYCLNVVAHEPERAGAVLLRAIEPRAGVEEMMLRRRVENPLRVANGPGKLCQALGVDLSHYGSDLRSPGGLFLAPGAAAGEVEAGPRVGISVAAERPYRFWLMGNAHVSKYRAGGKRSKK